jgi:hypothetical protein
MTPTGANLESRTDMATPPPARHDEEVLSKMQRAERQEAAIGAAVLRSLGLPPEFRRVTVVRLWANHFRVNVQTGESATSARVAHSFFLAADEDGRVIHSDPTIARLY